MCLLGSLVASQQDRRRSTPSGAATRALATATASGALVAREALLRALVAVPVALLEARAPGTRLVATVAEDQSLQETLDGGP